MKAYLLNPRHKIIDVYEQEISQRRQSSLDDEEGIRPTPEGLMLL